jgi:hypothetical protein
LELDEKVLKDADRRALKLDGKDFVAFFIFPRYGELPQRNVVPFSHNSPNSIANGDLNQLSSVAAHNFNPELPHPFRGKEEKLADSPEKMESAFTSEKTKPVGAF